LGVRVCSLVISPDNKRLHKLQKRHPQLTNPLSDQSQRTHPHTATHQPSRLFDLLLPLLHRLDRRPLPLALQNALAVRHGLGGARQLAGGRLARRCRLVGGGLEADDGALAGLDGGEALLLEPLFAGGGQGVFGVWD